MKSTILKFKVQKIILGVSALLLIGKFSAYYLTSSAGILTDAMESIVNVVAAVITLYSLYFATHPQDAKHPYGHGKAELLSSSVEGILIVLAGVLIMYEGVERLIYGGIELKKLDIGIVIIAIAGLVNYILGWYSINVGKKHHSIALVAGGKHLHSDTYSTIGLVLGLILVHVTGLFWIDSLLAILFGIIISYTGIKILKKNISNVLEESDNDILSKISGILSCEHEFDFIDVHNFKIMKFSSYFYVDCDLTLPWFYTIKEGHDACERLERIISAHFSEKLIFTVHSDSCDTSHCEHCKLLNCSYRTRPFVKSLDWTIEEITLPENN